MRKGGIIRQNGQKTARIEQRAEKDMCGACVATEGARVDHVTRMYVGVTQNHHLHGRSKTTRACKASSN